MNNTAKFTNCNAVKLIEEFETNTKYGDKTLTTTWKVVEGTKEPIIGIDKILKLGIQTFTGGESLEINRLCENNEGLVEQLIDQFSKLFKENLTRTNDIQQTQFISSTVITMKKDNSVKLAMDAKILNDNTIKRKAQMPNLEELLGQVSLSITKDETLPLYISTIDLEYPFGQTKLHP